MDWSHMHIIVNKYDLILVFNLQTVQYFTSIQYRYLFVWNHSQEWETEFSVNQHQWMCVNIIDKFTGENLKY